MKLPPSSALTSIALANLPLISASAINSLPFNDVTSNNNNGATAAHQETSNNVVDTGILSKPLFAPTPRHLQGGANCPSTCSPALCNCVAQYGYAEPCALELHAVCNGVTSTLEQCLPTPEYVEYYQNVYCPFAACRVSGGSYEKCQCDSYVNFCNVYQNKEGYVTLPKTVKYCSIANCCLDKVEDGGRMSCLLDTFKELALSNGEGVSVEGEGTASGGEAQAEESGGDGDGATIVTDTTDEATNESIDSTGSDAGVEDVSSPPPPQSDANWITTPSILVLTFGAFIWFAA